MAKMNKFEGSKKDMAQDAKLAKKYKMSPKEYEKSSVDAKHDKQQSMVGLNHGGSMYASGGTTAPTTAKRPEGMRERMRGMMGGKGPEGMRERMRGKGPEGMRGLTGVGQKPSLIGAGSNLGQTPKQAQEAAAKQAQESAAAGRSSGGRGTPPTTTKTATTAPASGGTITPSAIKAAQESTTTKTATTAPPTTTKTATGVKKGGSIKKLAFGGPMGNPMGNPMDSPMGSPAGGGMMHAPAATRPMPAATRPMPMAKGGSVNGVAKKGKTSTKMVKMAKGGSFRSSANGIASRGKTKGRMC